MPSDPQDNSQQQDGTPTTAELAGRVDALDSKLDQIISMFGAGKDKAHDASASAVGARLDAGSTVADEIRQQLDERDRQDQARRQDQDLADWRKGVDEKLAGMGENTPEPPVRRVERIMGYR